MYCAEEHEQLLVSRLSILNFLFEKAKVLQTELPSQRRYPLLILMMRRTSRASMRPHPGERRQREIGGCHRRLMTSRQVYVCRI